MDGLSVSLLGAALAGLISFASPCVLPLVPGYLSFLGGAGVVELRDGTVDRARRLKVMLAALAFVIGFGCVFVALGMTASAAGQFVARNHATLSVIAGAAIVLFGLHTMGVLQSSVLMRDTRILNLPRLTGPIGAFLIGAAFAFGWTPCVGPVLATILIVAAGREGLIDGVWLLMAYSFGMGLPFLLAAAFTGPFMRLSARYRRHMRVMEMVVGAVLVVTGVAIATGAMADVGYWLIETFPAFGRIG